MSIFKKENNSNFTIREISISALLMSIALIFSNIKLFQLPNGGSVTMISLLLISVIGYLFGIRIGLLSALTYGFFQLILGGYVIHPVQLIFDYPLAFMCLGLSGFFRNKKHGLALGYLIGCFAKYLCHVFTGVVFFREAGASLSASLSYSLVYNAYVIPEIIISLILIPILLPTIHKYKTCQLS